MAPNRRQRRVMGAWGSCLGAQRPGRPAILLDALAERLFEAGGTAIAAERAGHAGHRPRHRRADDTDRDLEGDQEGRADDADRSPPRRRGWRRRPGLTRRRLVHATGEGERQNEGGTYLVHRCLQMPAAKGSDRHIVLHPPVAGELSFRL